MRYFEKISGERLFLSHMNPNDAELYTKWLNDRAVSEPLGNTYAKNLSLPFEREYIEKLAKEGHHYTIVLRNGERAIGNISLMDVNHINATATLGIFIGGAEHRGCGYGTEAIRLLLGYGFNTLRLHNIQLHVNADNEQGIACYKKAGFCEFGRRRQAEFHNGHVVDLVHMDILSGEFSA